MEENTQHEHHKPGDKFAREAIRKILKDPFGYIITHYRLIYLLVITIVALGTLALFTIDRESDPEVKIPIAVVTTVYPGTSPADMENLVTDPLENNIEELEDVKLITSSSVTGVSSIVVEFEAEADLEDSIRKLQDKVTETGGLPDEAEDPIVIQVRANDFPIIAFSLAGDLTDEQFKQLGELVQDELEAIPGVSDAPLLGTLDKEFSVVIDSGRLQSLSVPINQVVGAIAQTNIDTPLGGVTINGIDYNLRTVSKFQSIDDLKDVVVKRNGESVVRLSDVATVTEKFRDAQTVSRISIGGETPTEAITLQVFKKTGGNILDIVDTAKLKVEELQENHTIPTNVKVDISSDFSQFIRNDLNTLGSSGVQAAVLIFIIILVALSFREAILSFLAIPLTFLISFILLNATGNTINSLTLFALVLSLGLLVDTFIVILEGIFHNMRAGHDSIEASLLSVAHYRKPLLSGILTTISAFVPMLLVSGILGEYLAVFPVTIAITLGSSLFVSLIIVPALAAQYLKRGSISSAGKDSILEKHVTNKLRHWYRKTIVSFLKSKRKKRWFIFGNVGAFVLALAVLVMGIVPVQLFPNQDVDFTFINIEMPVGTDLEETNEVVRQVEDKLFKYPEIKNFVTSVGQSADFGFGSSGSTRDHLGSITVNFVDVDDRDRKSYELTKIIRDDLRDINEGNITIEEISGGPPTGAPIEARITGFDLDTLNQITDLVEDKLKKTEGVINVESNQDVSPADFTFSLNKQALSQAGLSAGEVSGALRTAIFGITATEVQIAGEDIDVNVKLDKDKITSVEEIKNLSIISNSGQEVKLAQVADFSLEPALSSIRHRNLERTFSVSAELEAGYTAPLVVEQVEAELAQENIPRDFEVSFGGEVEDIEQSFTELWNAMIVAVMLILIILVLQFDSFLRPVVILMTLPLMLIGVVIGMLLLGLPFSFSVFLGLISLAGIVVNDAIVLMDKTKRNIEEKKMPPAEAVADAGDTRLQPILLTSITTIVGVVPLAFANEFWIGLSVSIIFGLAFATVLQLFVIPALFVKFEGKKLLKKMNQ